MQESNDKRLTDIESSITRLAKMQGCVFGAVLNLHETSKLFQRREAISTSAVISLESGSQHRDHFLAFVFGALGVLSLTLSAFALYFVTQVSSAAIMSLVSLVLVFVLFFFAALEHRQANREFRTAAKETEEAIETIRKEEAALDHELDQMVTLWNKLVPDDLVSESRSEG
jgi:uncharacterized membrane protein